MSTFLVQLSGWQHKNLFGEFSVPWTKCYIGSFPFLLLFLWRKKQRNFQQDLAIWQIEILNYVLKVSNFYGQARAPGLYFYILTSKSHSFMSLRNFSNQWLHVANFWENLSLNYHRLKNPKIHSTLDESKRIRMEHRPGEFCVWSDELCIFLRKKGICRKAEAKLNSRWKGNPSVTPGCQWSGLVIKNATANRELQSEPLRMY